MVITKQILWPMSLSTCYLSLGLYSWWKWTLGNLLQRLWCTVQDDDLTLGSLWCQTSNLQQLLWQRCARVTPALVWAAGLIRVKCWVKEKRKTKKKKKRSKHELLSASLLPLSSLWSPPVVNVIVINIVGEASLCPVCAKHTCLVCTVL